VLALNDRKCLAAVKPPLREVIETLPVGLTEASFWLAEALAAASEVTVG
jgi:hypothetical protein